MRVLVLIPLDVMLCTYRSQFAEEQITMTSERLVTYGDIIKAENTNLARLEDERNEAQEDITESEETIKTMQEELKVLNEELEAKTKKVEEVKKTTSRAGKVLDQAIKEISTHVSLLAGHAVVKRSVDTMWNG